MIIDPGDSDKTSEGIKVSPITLPSIRNSLGSPVLVSTNIPTVYFPSGHSPIREDVPIPPFHPKHVIPVPAPTAPSSIFGEYADEIAFIT